MRRRLLLGSACGLSLGALAADAPWPARAVRIVVPYTPGGFTDNIARLLAPRLAERLAQPVHIENRAGANSIIGVEHLAHSAPDGYSFGIVIAAYAANVSLYPKLPYNTRDLQPVSLLGSAPLMAVARIGAPFGTFAELLTYAKSHPGRVTFASSGNGSAAHLTCELLKQRTGTYMVHIPYTGGAQAVMALAGGQIDLLFDVGAGVVNAVRQGRARFLGVASERRISQIPDVPTFIEQGLPDFVSGSWAGMLAPAAVERATTQRMAGELQTIVHSDEVSERFAAMVTVPVGGTPEQFSRFLEAEIRKWGDVIRRAGVQPS